MDDSVLINLLFEDPPSYQAPKLPLQRFAPDTINPVVKEGAANASRRHLVMLAQKTTKGRTGKGGPDYSI